MHIASETLHLELNVTQKCYQFSSLIIWWVRLTESGAQIIIVTAMDRSCGYGGAILVMKRGLDDGDKWPTEYLRSLGHASFARKHDKERLVRALVWQVVDTLTSQLDEATYVTSRKHSHDASRPVE